MNLKKTLFLCVLSGVATGLPGCFSVDEYFNIHRVEEEPNEEGDPSNPPGGNGTNVDPTQPGDVIKPGGSQGVEDGDDDDNDEIEPGGTEVEAPFSITSIAPSSGPLGGGYEIQLRGAKYSRTDRVTIGTVESSRTTFVSGMVMRATVPEGHRGCVDVRVDRADGSESVTLKEGFCYTEQVEIQSVEPSIAVEGSVTPVVIRGTGFENAMSIYAQSGDETRALLDVVVGEGVVEAVLPSLTAGEVTFVVNTPNGQTELKDAVTILPSLEVGAVSPQVVPANTPSVLEISGRGFEAASMKSMVGSVHGTSTVLSDEKLQVALGGLAPGCYDVVVYDAYRQKRADKAFYVVDAAGDASIVGVLPSRGPLSGGEATIIGVLPSTGEVYFGETASTVLSRDALSWVVEVPSVLFSQTVDVSLNDVVLKDAYSYVAEPMGDSLVPAHGKAGTEVTLKGSGFDETLRVFADQFEAENVQVVDGTTVKATMPLGSGEAKISFIQNDASYLTPLKFSYDEDLALYGVTPSEIATIGGTSVTLHGQGFGPEYRVILDGVEIEDVVWNGPGSATFISPEHSAGTSVIEVRDAQGNVAASTEVLYYEPSGLNSHVSGGVLNGRMNVTVMTVSTNELITGADVYIDVGEKAYLHGTTNGSGQVSFESSLLMGTQIIYACYSGYSCNSIQSFNARDVTIYLEKWERPDSGSSTITPPSDPPPDDGTINPIDMTVTYPPKDSYITGKVSGFDKIDLETANTGDWVRAALVIQSQLSPYSGSYAQGDVYMLFDEGATYKIKARKGDVAVGLVCGLYNKQTTAFDPRYFGARTGLYVTSGVTLKADLNCPLPLNQTQSVKILNIPHGVVSTSLSSTAYLNMGNYGYLGGFMKGYSENDLVIITKIPPLRGQLEGATLALQTYLYRDEVYSGSFNSYGIEKTDSPIEIGPLVSLPKLDTLPAENYYSANEGQQTTLHNGKGFMKRGRITWSVEHPEHVDFYALAIRGYYPGSNQLLWQFYLPGNATSAEFIGDRDYTFEGSEPTAVYVTLTAYKSLRDGYDFNSFSTLDTKHTLVDSSASTSIYIPWVNYYGDDTE